MKRNFPHFKVRITEQYISVVHTLFTYFITFSCFRKLYICTYTFAYVPRQWVQFEGFPRVGNRNDSYLALGVLGDTVYSSLSLAMYLFFAKLSS